jgi:pimeloyl-ACP methyl ester carboxylesterase
MKRSWSSRCAVALLFAAAACSENTPDAITPGDGGAPPATLDRPSTTCADGVDSVYGDPGPLTPDAAARGAIVKCARDPDLSKDAVQAKLVEVGYQGKPAASGARVYRISYRTERGNAASTPAVSSAIVYIPDSPRATKLPIVVAGRGSRGQAPQCALSKFDATQAGVNADAYRLIYPLVGSGYAVIVPDLAGYANFNGPGNPPSAYGQVDDVGRSTLDGARALKRLFPALDDKVIMVGHSQGGHNVLAALAIAESYAFTTPIAGVAVYAPIWLSARVAGAILYRPVGKDLPFSTSPFGAVSAWYHYTHAELLDGAGEGVKLFAADKRDAIKSFVESVCWDQSAETLASLATYPDEIFDPAFASSVAYPSISGDCASDATCTKWQQRYVSDRPHLAGMAKIVPIQLVYGLKDESLDPGRMKCALDRLKGDGASLSVCVDPEATHNSIGALRGEFVADWIASVALAGPSPAPCPADDSAITVSCTTPPPND